MWKHWLKDKSTQNENSVIVFSPSVLTVSLFRSLQNISGASQQNSIAACSSTTDVDRKKYEVFPYIRSKIGIVYMLLLSQILTVAVKLQWLAYLIIFTACRGFE